jgi:hypothetical protein
VFRGTCFHQNTKIYNAQEHRREKRQAQQYHCCVRAGIYMNSIVTLTIAIILKQRDLKLGLTFVRILSERDLSVTN